MRPIYRAVAFSVAAFALIAAAVINARVPAISPALTDTLLSVTVALAVYAGGWRGGAVALAVVPLPLLAGPFASVARLTGGWLECLLVMVVMVVGRRSVMRFRSSESKLRAVLASMDDLIFVLHEDGTYLEVASTDGTFLYTREPLVGRRVQDVLPPAVAQWVLAQISAALQSGVTVDGDYSLVIEGRTVWFGAKVSPMSGSRVVFAARDITRRKLAEEALHRANAELEEHVATRTRELDRSERLYRGIVEEARDIIFTLDPARTITSLNPAFERITGLHAKDWIGRSFIDLICEEERPQAQELFATALRHEALPLTRYTVCLPDGRRVVFETSLSEQMVGDSSVGFLGFSRDVTHRVAEEKELRRSEKQLAESQRIARLGNWSYTPDRNSVWFSIETARIMGFEETERKMPYDEFLNMLQEHQRSDMAEVLATLFTCGEHEWEFPFRTAAGVEKILACSAQLIRSPDGGPSRIVGTTQDITEQKRAEQRVRESEERFRLLARATSDAVWDLDLMTGQVWRGEGYETLFGYADGALGTKSEAWRELIHPDDRDRVTESTREAIEAGQPSWSAEYRFRRADGSYAQILDRAYIVRNAQKRPVRMLGAMFDMSERKQMQEQLEQAKRLSSLGRIAASIAHEFNNVLMGIQPNLEVVRRRSTADLAKPIEHIVQSVHRGKRVTDEILRFTRPAEAVLRCVDVRDFFSEWEAEIRPILSPGIDLEIDIAEPDLHISADSAQISQVLTNLALNARDAMEEKGGSLSVRVSQAKSFGAPELSAVKTADRFVHIRVSDTGVGMSREQLAHVFEPLFTTKSGGTGLGLAVSYHIVSRHSGMIFAESEAGHGTTFHVLIPATSPVLEAANKKSSRLPPGLRRIVIVEDEKAVAFGIQSLLELDGIRVEVIATGGEAVPAIERTGPDAVILDIGLPDVDGVEVYGRIAARWPQMPVLFSSGHADAAKLDTYLQKPNIGMLLKPYDFDALCDAMSTLLTSAGRSA